jgi:hypothetical protein
MQPMAGYREKRIAFATIRVAAALRVMDMDGALQIRAGLDRVSGGARFRGVNNQ